MTAHSGSEPRQPGQDTEARAALAPGRAGRGAPLAEAGGRVSVGGGADTELAIRCITAAASPPGPGGPRFSARDAVLPVARYATALAHALANEGAPSARIEVDAVIRRARRQGAAAGLVGLAVRVSGCGLAADRLRALVRRLAADWLAAGALPPGMDARVFRCTVWPAAAAARAAPASPAVAPAAAWRTRGSPGRGSGGARPRRVLAVVTVVAIVALALSLARPRAQAVGGEGPPPAAAGEATPPANPPPTAVRAPRSSAALAAPLETPTSAATMVATAAPAPVIAAATAGSTPVAADAIGTGDPVQTVRSFYVVLGQGDYDRLTGLLTGRLRDTVPWQPEVLRQRTPPGQLTVERAELVSQDADGRAATVAVRVKEMIWPGSDRSRAYVGTWQLVRGPSGWLLDESDLQVVDDGEGPGG